MTTHSASTRLDINAGITVLEALDAQQRLYLIARACDRAGLILEGDTLNEIADQLGEAAGKAVAS